MSTILLTWELGGNAGHVQPLGIIASELKKRGHKVLIAVKDVCTAECHLAKKGIEFIQAPVWRGRIDPLTPSAINYAELLMLVGYLNPNQIAGQIRSWIHLMEWVKPDLILANHSPSVLLASQITGIKAMTIGSGFHTPPVMAPMPSIQPYVKTHSGRLHASENKVLTIINQAISKCGGTPLNRLSEIFEFCGNYFLTLPETDHYSERNNIRYWGIMQSSKNAPDPVWPEGDGPKVYVYMPHHTPPFQPLMKNLKQLGWPTLIVSLNIDVKMISQLSSPNLAFRQELLNLGAVARQADLVVNNCSHGTVVEMLQRGCRQLVIPLQVEQSMLAHRLSNQGLVVASSPTLPCYLDLLEKTNFNPTLKSNIEKFNSIYGKIDPLKQLTELIDDIDSSI